MSTILQKVTKVVDFDRRIDLGKMKSKRLDLESRGIDSKVVEMDKTTVRLVWSEYRRAG